MQIGKGIEPDHLPAMLAQFPEGFVVEIPYLLRLGIQVHLSQVFPVLLDKRNDFVLVRVVLAQVDFTDVAFGVQYIVHNRGDVLRVIVCQLLHTQCLQQVVCGDFMIDHFLVEGIPVGPAGSVREADFQYWQPGFAHE